MPIIDYSIIKTIFIVIIIYLYIYINGKKKIN